MFLGWAYVSSQAERNPMLNFVSWNWSQKSAELLFKIWPDHCLGEELSALGKRKCRVEAKSNQADKQDEARGDLSFHFVDSIPAKNQLANLFYPSSWTSTVNIFFFLLPGSI